jgi:superfamily II DNA or RNA helicase
VSKWEIQCPVARLAWDANQGGYNAFAALLGTLPGLREKNNVWSVPLNAIEVVEALAERCAVTLAHASWEKPARPAPGWEEVEAALRAGGEVEEFVLDGFLMPYQREAITYGWNRDGVHFWHPTGSGKTLSGIITALSVPGPLVIVTRAASRIQYGREVEKFTHLKSYVVRPESQLRKKSKRLPEYLAECEKSQQRPVIVLGWESLKDNLDVVKALAPGPVIYDESHRGKNSKRWEVLHMPDIDPELGGEDVREYEAEARSKDGFFKLTDEGPKIFVPYMSTATAAAMVSRLCQKRICTTATPVKDRVRDLYAQLDLAEPNAWGSTTAWMTRYADRKPGTYGGYDTTGSSHIPELNKRLERIAHILDYKETHRELPPKRRQSVYVAAEDQCRPSAGFPQMMQEAAERGPGAVLEVKLMRSASMKRKAVLDLVESHVLSKQKVVIFTGRKADCDTLGEQVRKNSAVKSSKAAVWSAHGSQSTTARQVIVDRYMAHPGPCVLVATGHAFGESLNLHDTDAALFVMLPYDPGQFRQWEGRFTRLGQKRPVVIYYVIAEGTVDEHVAGILIEKLPAVERIAKDTELAEAGDILAGYDSMDLDELAQSVLDDLDFG